MSQRTEAERQAIIRRELYSTESEASSTNPGPNTNAPSPYFPSSISSSSSSSHPSGESPETANVGESSGDLVNVSSAGLHPSAPESQTVSKIAKEKESRTLGNVSRLSDTSVSSSSNNSAEEAELARNKPDFRMVSTPAFNLSSTSSERSDSNDADDSNVVNKTENIPATDSNSDISPKSSERSAVASLKAEASAAENVDKLEYLNKDLPDTNQDENSDISHKRLPDLLSEEGARKDVQKTMEIPWNVQEPLERSAHESMTAFECSKDVDFSKHYPISKSAGASTSHSPSQEQLTPKFLCRESEQSKHHEKPRGKSREVSASEIRIFRDSAHAKEQNIHSEYQKRPKSISPDKESYANVTKNLSTYTSDDRKTDESNLKCKRRPKRSRKNIASTNKKHFSKKSPKVKSRRKSSSAEARQSIRSREQNVEGEILVPAHDKGRTIDEIQRAVELIEIRLLNDRLRAERLTGVRHIFARILSTENQVDFLKFNSILRCSAHLEPYVISLDRRCSQHLKGQKILNDLLAVANEECRNIEARRLIIMEAFQKALQCEELLGEAVYSRDGPRSSALDIFQETPGNEYIPEISEEDFEPFNRALRICSESNSSRNLTVPTVPNAMPSSSSQLTDAEKDILNGTIRICITSALSARKESYEHCSEGSQRTRRRYSAALDEANRYLSNRNISANLSSSGNEEISSRQAARKKVLKDHDVKKNSTLRKTDKSSKNSAVNKEFQKSEPAFKYNLRSRSKSADSHSSEVEICVRTGRPTPKELENKLGSGQKCLNESVSNNVSKSESNLSTSNRRKLPIVKRIILPSTVDSDRSTRKTGYLYRSIFSSNMDQEESSAKKYALDYPPLTTSASEISRENTMGKPSTRNFRFYSNDSQRSGSMADVSQSATESQESAAAKPESSECMRNDTESAVRSSASAAEVDVSSVKSDASDIAKSFVCRKDSSDLASKSSAEENIEKDSLEASHTELSDVSESSEEEYQGPRK